MTKNYRGRCSSATSHIFARRVKLIPLLVMIVSCAIINSAVVIAQTKSTGEYQVKAEYLYKFAKFTDWPPDAFAGSKQPLGVCIFGRDPFGRTLELVLLGKSVGDRPVMLGRATQIQDLSGCHIVFIAGSENLRIPILLSHLQGRAILLVGETEGFAASGGIIQFTVEREHVHFFINPDAAARAGLKISSKLLALAQIVRDSSQSASRSELK